MSDADDAPDGVRLNADTSLLLTPDYDEAVAEFVRHAVESLMSAADPIYASLRRLPLPEGVVSIRVEVGDARTTSPEVQMSERVEIQRSDVVEGNLEEFHIALAQIADSHLLQFMRPFFEHVGDAAEAVGNTMTVEGSAMSWDDVLDAWEKVEWAVDRAGRVRQPQMVVGSEVAARLEELPNPTVQQQQRAESISMRKQEEHVSRRRSRRLR
jgi:hypothetical protein